MLGDVAGGGEGGGVGALGWGCVGYELELRMDG